MKNVDVREVYNNKLNIANYDNFDLLISEMNKRDKELKISDGYDRTLLLDYSESKNSIDSFQNMFGKVLKSWIKEEITCPINYTYSLFRLNKNQFIIKI